MIFLPDLATADVPGDIQATANALIEASWDGDRYGFLEDYIERAILAERNRCLAHLRNVSWSYPEAVVKAVDAIEAGDPV